ncbi:hypothetical protein [Rhodanobacter lindaniclasticus]|uniref:hypothetical protein n=1 Tax=Rhodanobacter lindaniclasticus TaxID=75310 RepID=UPI001FE935EA|nr:hypothetical protein [Rhodanobacter lindaniclasticus]
MIALLPLVIALEPGRGLAIFTGAFTRWIALALLQMPCPCVRTSAPALRPVSTAAG